MPRTPAPQLSRWPVVALVVVMAFLLWVSLGAMVAGFEEPQDADLLLGVPIGVFNLALAMATFTLAAWTFARRQDSVGEGHRNVPLAIALIVLGVVGWAAAFALAADKVRLVLEPSADLSCNFSVLVQCSANLESWQGSVFGFPNPLVGVAGWAAVIVVGGLLLARVRLAAWFWIVFNLGVAGALAFVIWLIGQSIFVLGTLCPWCLVTWAVTIPLFWAVTLHNAREGRFGRRAAGFLGPAYSWVPVLTVVSYVVIAVVAQLQLDVLTYL